MDSTRWTAAQIIETVERGNPGCHDRCHQRGGECAAERNWALMSHRLSDKRSLIQSKRNGNSEGYRYWKFIHAWRGSTAAAPVMPVAGQHSCTFATRPGCRPAAATTSGDQSTARRHHTRSRVRTSGFDWLSCGLRSHGHVPGWTTRGAGAGPGTRVPHPSTDAAPSAAQRCWHHTVQQAARHTGHAGILRGAGPGSAAAPRDRHRCAASTNKVASTAATAST